MEPTASFDPRFSDPAARPAPWDEVRGVLDGAELFWLTTVRTDGRPHVTPLVAVTVDEVVHFVTGLDEQKARNLEHNAHVALTTGENAWSEGMDLVVEGTAVRVTDQDALRAIAAAYDAKYRGDWHFEVGDGVFRHGEGGEAGVFRVEPAKVLAFAKDPHGQTTFRF
jgi:general stress protein 26